jgi:hypothetical protein
MGHPPGVETNVRPVRRPPVALRALLGLVGLAAVLFNVAIMLSDRAPRFLRRMFGDVVVRLSERIDAQGRIATEQLPETDAIVHIAVWAAATALVGLTIWTWRGLVLAALTMLAVSAAVEVGQGVYSSTRRVEIDDAIANAAGVALGVAAAALCYVAWSAVAAIGGTPDRALSRRG